MSNKRFTIVAMVLAMMALFAGMIVNAQDDTTTFNSKPGMHGFGFNFESDLILEATGLTQQELWQALQDGSTIAELIEANGGDVDSVIAALVAEATTNINAQSDTIIANLEDNITNRLNGTFERRNGFGGRGFGLDIQSEIILNATGLTQEELWQALQDGSTVAELIEANDGDVDSVIADLVAEATTNINAQVEEGRLTQEQADTILATLEDNITNRINGAFERLDGFRNGMGRPDGFGGRDGRRGGHGNGFDPNNNVAPTEEPASPDNA